MTTKQIKHSFDDGKNGRCALGAALDADNALYLTKEINSFSLITRHFPILYNVICHPSRNNCWFSLLATIMDLNDFCGWSREEIADWIESIENKEESKNITEKEAVLQ